MTGPTSGFTAQVGKGRPKGVPNKTTTLAKAAIAEAFDLLGGTAALVAWAGKDDDTRKAFYTSIYPKLLPLQVTGGSEGDVPLNIAVSFVSPG